MSLRCKEEGWQLAAMEDSQQRRGIWYRLIRNRIDDTITGIEICGGREGDDCYLRLLSGELVTNAQVLELLNVLSTSKWVRDLRLGDE